MNLPPLPTPDTHCFDEDTKKDVWSFSEELMREYAIAVLEMAAGVCDDLHYKWRWDNQPDSLSGPRDCAAAIRALIDKKSNE